MLVRKVSFTAADAVLDSVTEEQIWNIIQENEQGASHALQEATATAATMTTTTTNTGTSTSATAATVQPRSPVQQAMASTTATTTATATATTTSTQRRAEPTISHPQQLITPRGSTDAGKDVVTSANGAPRSPLPATAAIPNQQHLALISTPPPSGYVSEKSATPSPTNPLSQRGSNENITSRNEPQQSIQLSLQQSLQQTAQLSQVPVAQAPSHVTVSSSVLESDTPAEQDISNALGITYKPAAIKPPFGSMQTPFTQATQLPVVQVRPVSSKNSRSVEAPQTPSILSNQQQHQQQQQQTVRSSTPVGNSLISPGEQFKASSPEQAVSLSFMMANSMSASMHQLSNNLQQQQQQTMDPSPVAFNDEQLPPVEQNTTTDSGGSAAVNVSDTALDLDQVCDYENEHSNANANANANNERANETVPSTVNRRPKRILRRRPINLNVPATTTSSRQHTQPPSGPLPPLPPPPPPPPPPNRTNFPQNLPETPQFREFTRNDNPHGIRTLEKILNVATYKLATADGSKSGQLTGDFHSNVKSVGGCISSEGNGNPALKQVRDATHQYFVRSRALKHQRDGTQPTEEPVDLESTAYSKLGTKLFAVPSGLLNTFRRFAQERGVIGGLLMGHRFQNGLSVVTHLVLPPKNIPTRSPGIPRIEWHELLEQNIPVQSIVTPTTQENGQQNSYLLTNLVLGWIASTNAEGGIKAADWTPLHESRSSQTWSISKRISKNGIGFILRVPQSPSSPSSPSTPLARPQTTTAANRIFNDPMIPNVEDYYFNQFRNDSRAIDKVSRLKLDNGYDYPVVVVNIDYKVFDTSQLSQSDLGALLASGPLSNTNGSVVRAV
ncbi:hypothetical protein GQ42DRAFT_72412 [Ramicandelaber brevisporus]|nr:hypothetical protein GQ42DRAFT_72412 [Ramicandelaber brevisporus]